MNVNDLNKNIIKVSFSDLSEYDNWDPRFWISMNQYINQYKALGKDKAVEFVAERVKKMGIDNNKTLLNMINSWAYNMTNDEHFLSQEAKDIFLF